MSATPIYDELTALSKSAQNLGNIAGRDSMKRDVLAVLMVIKPRTKGVEEAIRRVTALRIDEEGEQ